MKIGLVATTIHTPYVLPLLHKYGPDVRFFVALDENTPEEAVNFCQHDVPNVQVLFIRDQQKWKCSAPIGFKNIQRRNIATLEALAWGADILVSWDTDNIPLDKNYFKDFECALRSGAQHSNYEHYKAWDGLLASNPWFDVGQLLNPISPHRGFPHDKIAVPQFEPVVDVRVGVAAGICLGDPDISAVTRIASGPTVHSVSEVLRSGIVTDPRKTWTVFNTQNTSFICELAPAMFCPPGLGRFDDIVASLVTQRIMRERNLHVHFGKPFIFQQRNPHDLVKDLSAELWGMLNIKNVADRLDNLALAQTDSVVGQVRRIYTVFHDHVEWFPKQASAAALSFCDDVETVL